MEKVKRVMAVLFVCFFLFGFKGAYILADKDEKIANKRPAMSIVSTLKQWEKTSNEERSLLVLYLAERMEEVSEPFCEVGIIQPGINETHIWMDIWCVKRTGMEM